MQRTYTTTIALRAPLKPPSSHNLDHICRQLAENQKMRTATQKSSTSEPALIHHPATTTTTTTTLYQIKQNGLSQHNEPLIIAAANAVGTTQANSKYTPWPTGAIITDITSTPGELETFSFGFRNVLGITSYISQRTRPETLVHNSMLASKQSNPNANDYQLLKHLVKYLYTTRKLRQHLKRNDTQSRGGIAQQLRIIATCDSDYAGCPITRRRMSGLDITLNIHNDDTFPLQTSIPILSRAKRQETVSNSSNEGELKSAIAAAKVLVYLQNVLEFVEPNLAVPRLYCDNKGAIHMAHGIGKRKRSKHIDVKHFYIRELISNGKITLHHIDADDNVSDAMTKSLGKNKFLKFRGLLNVK